MKNSEEKRSLATLVGSVAGAVAATIILAACVPTTVDTPTDVATGGAQTVASATPLPSEAPTPLPTPTAAPASSPTDTPAPVQVDDGNPVPPPEPDQGTALAAALVLAVKGRSAKTGYDRDQFGSGWVDVDRNGCDTRSDMLMLRLTPIDVDGKCKVMSGDLADPYTGTSVRFVRGGKSEVDIDHIVALSDAWQKGAAGWEFAQRVAFANDPLNLEPVDASANRQKGDGDAATWLPSNKAYRCGYVARQVAVKTKYDVWVTTAELGAMTRILDACPEELLPADGGQPIIATNTGGSAPKPAPKKTKAPQPEGGEGAGQESGLDERFEYCNRLPAGYGPYYRDKDPEYEWYSDRDKDGVVCE